MKKNTLSVTRIRKQKCEPLGTKTKREQIHKITQKDIEFFYNTLSLPLSRELPLGKFQLFDHVEIKETASTGA